MRIPFILDQLQAATTCVTHTCSGRHLHGRTGCKCRGVADPPQVHQESSTILGTWPLDQVLGTWYQAPDTFYRVSDIWYQVPLHTNAKQTTHGKVPHTMPQYFDVSDICTAFIKKMHGDPMFSTSAWVSKALRKNIGSCSPLMWILMGHSGTSNSQLFQKYCAIDAQFVQT